MKEKETLFLTILLFALELSPIEDVAFSVCNHQEHIIVFFSFTPCSINCTVERENLILRPFVPHALHNLRDIAY